MISPLIMRRIYIALIFIKRYLGKWLQNPKTQYSFTAHF